MTRSLFLAGCISLCASAAAAELTYAHGFAASHRLTFDGAPTATIDLFGGALEYTARGWTLSGEVGRIGGDADDVSVAAASADYRFASGLALGLAYDNTDVDGEDTSVATVYGMYEFGTAAVGLSLGDADEVDDTIVTVFAAWDVSPSGRVGIDIVDLDSETLAAAYADYRTDRYDLRADIVTSDGLDIGYLGGAYSVGHGFAVTGSLTGFMVDDVDGHAVLLGGRYSLTDGIALDLSAGKLDFGGGDTADIVTFGLTYEMGRKTSMRRSLSNIQLRTVGLLLGTNRF